MYCLSGWQRELNLSASDLKMVGDILPCCPYPDCRNKISAIVRGATIRKCRNSKQTNKTLAIGLGWKSSEFCHSIGWRGWWSFYRGEGWESPGMISQKNPQLKAQWDSYAWVQMGLCMDKMFGQWEFMRARRTLPPAALHRLTAPLPSFYWVL